MRKDLWLRANLELIAKGLAELLYEEVLQAENIGNKFHVLFNEVSYEFIAKLGKWNFLQIDHLSIKRHPDTGELLASTFFKDANSQMGMSSITLTHFMEEMNNTLFSEIKVLENKENLQTQHLTKLSGEELHRYLSGHPKILLNKGRLGFTSEDIKKYAPEYSVTFRVFWLAIQNDLLIKNSNNFQLEEILSSDELKTIKSIMANKGMSMDEYSLMPVHPWQFKRYIETQYQKEIINEEIVPLDFFGDDYLPQISIRTLANCTHKKSCDLKLSLTILNTSAYRGISADNLHVGIALSNYMENICKNDSLLCELGTQVLKELYVANVPQGIFGSITDAPYRYNELLGCVARESAKSKIKDDEIAIMTGSLFFIGEDNKTLIGEYIKLSKLSPSEWMKKYFQHVIIPLYHLQLNYGIGIVSHGQNIVLKLKNFAPSGMFLKDFQGDLRLNAEFLEKFPRDLQVLKALPPEYLIHDLITGHFITVLRFISPLMEKYKLLNEDDFYKILGLEIKNYLNKHHPDLSAQSPINLLRPTFEKVILNKVRFRIGYEDSAARPLPLLGTKLINPLVEYLEVKNKDSYEA